MILKESGIILFTENYESSLRFYIDKLGLQLREQKDNLAILAFGNSYLMIENDGVASPTPKSRHQSSTVLRLDVYDFEDTISELRNRGVHVEIYEFDWGTIGFIVDPEGNKIEIKEALSVIYGVFEIRIHQKSQHDLLNKLLGPCLL